jgi:predicted DNA-binding transcriptional regulator AlpA
MRDELQSALALAATLPASELPQLCADLELIRVTCLARITSPATEAREDTLLEVPEAAHRLGISPDYLYRHSTKFPFTRRIGRKLLFSSAGLDIYLRKSR